MRPNAPREKKTTSRRVPFLSNEFDALKLRRRFCARKSSSGESWKARARLAEKVLWGDCFPSLAQKKREKISHKVVFLPLFFFCPFFGALFFIASLFFFGLVCPFFGGKGNLFYRV